MTTNDLPEHVQRNRVEWDNNWAAEYGEWAPRAWAQDAFTWGTYALPEADIGALPSSVDGMDVIELGCGTAFISAWLARMGARPVGIDNSPKQLETARAMQDQFDLHFPLHLANAEDLPFPDASFDFAISEYGASIWCDPMKWIPEAARVLRPGGHLVFLVNGVLMALCSDPDDASDTSVSTQLQRPLFGMYRIEVSYDDAVDFHIPHGQMIRILRESGFEIEQLIEPQPPADATALHGNENVPWDWARQWPSEEIWVARKR